MSVYSTLEDDNMYRSFYTTPILISDPITSHVYLFIHEASKAKPVKAAKLQIVGNPFIHACKHVFFFSKELLRKKSISYPLALDGVTLQAHILG